MLLLSALTRAGRHQAFADIDDAIVTFGGWVEGHAMFSNKAATFRFVLPARAFLGLADQLNAKRIHLDAESSAAIQALKADDAETFAVLGVTFIHDEPDMSREVPAIDG